jgi:hypothetical protein
LTIQIEWSNMDFVTKKEYDAAIAVIEKALQCQQLQLINVTSQEKSIIKRLSFEDEGSHLYSSNAITFISASQAAKDILHQVRKDLKYHKDHSAGQAKIIEALESKEQKLVTQLSTLKE